jgi:hypothetical protein
MKALLLHNGNKHPPIPLAQAVHMKETCTNIQGLLKKLCYKDHQWNLGADRRVVAVLTGLQGGNMKICCFQCEWDSRAWNWHYQWPLRGETIPGQKK